MLALTHQDVEILGRVFNGITQRAVIPGGASPNNSVRKYKLLQWKRVSIMLIMLFIGILMASILPSCSSPITSMLSATATPVSAPTDTAEPALPEQSVGFEHSSVAEELASLEARKDVSIKNLKGWIVATEADGLTTWAFAAPDDPAYPAVAKRVFYRDQDGWHLKMAILCEAEQAACDEFIRHFESLNEPIYQLIDQQEP